MNVTELTQIIAVIVRHDPGTTDQYRCSGNNISIIDADTESLQTMPIPDFITGWVAGGGPARLAKIDVALAASVTDRIRGAMA